MSEAKIVKTIEMPAEGPLVLDFVLYYKTGSYDHRRNGNKFGELELPSGARYSAYALADGVVPGVLIESSNTRSSSKHETSKTVLIIDSTAPLPLIVHGTAVDEYHPDYYNEQGLDWEDRKPTIDNKDLEYRVVAHGSAETGASC